MAFYRSPLSLSDALSFLSSIERSIQEHNLTGIKVDIKVLANNEFVLYISPDGYYLWDEKDWSNYAKKQRLLYVRKKGHNGTE